MSNLNVLEILTIGVIGLGFLLAVFAYRLLRQEMRRDPPRALLIRAVYRFMIFSVVLCLIGLVSEFAARSGPSPISVSVLDDPGFWKKVYDVMPPSFIKEYRPDGEHLHVSDNETLRRFQGPPGTSGAVSADFKKRIKLDHEHGDDKAYSQQRMSFQLEWSEPGGGRPPQPILTTKTRFDYRNQQYIVGTYVPVELPDDLEASTLSVKVNGSLPMFGLLLSSNPNESIEVDVGDAILQY